MTRFELVTSSLPRKRSTPELHRLKEKSGRRGSNSRHSAWKADALPTELLPQFLYNMSFNKWGEQDSNLWRWKPADLQSALVGRLSISPQVKNQQITINIEPVEGFEPTTPRLQITCSGQLSYTGKTNTYTTKNKRFYFSFARCKYTTIFCSDNKKNIFFQNKLLTPPLFLSALDKWGVLLYG